MMRRSPTRIDMRLDDLQEYETTKDPEKKLSSAMNPPLWGGKVPQSEIHDRIGYIPQSNPPTHNRGSVNDPHDVRIIQ